MGGSVVRVFEPETSLTDVLIGIALGAVFFIAGAWVMFVGAAGPAGLWGGHGEYSEGDGGGDDGGDDD